MSPTIHVWLGNRQAVQGEDRQALPGKRCTSVTIRPDASLLEAASEITSPNGVWAAHSDAAAPAWVASTDPALAELLAAHYGCELRDPDPEA
ncbi:hypothetical protein Aph01nite_73860 [Acrocarpospora phusangensis]|uniref:Uncharacterized protein n=1 Tax=Acrocarpospora phusangensis TaxID=1070424 RepID=A0A919QJQ0_9ACTN|nr:hypothetical protein [Acrocarpospora phusangensis]GIH29076.1 hypothetical protein Aph01nite_73860 [Acrocarpospora phusangensis]